MKVCLEPIFNGLQLLRWRCVPDFLVIEIDRRSILLKWLVLRVINRIVIFLLLTPTWIYMLEI